MERTYTLEVKKFKVIYNGKEFGPDTELGPIIPNVDEKTALSLLQNPLQNVIKQPQAVTVETEHSPVGEDLTLEAALGMVAKAKTVETLQELQKEFAEALDFQMDVSQANTKAKMKTALQEALEAHFSGEEDNDEEDSEVELPPIEGQ